MALKMAVVGGGSSYTPELIEGILLRQGPFPVAEVQLLDVEDQNGWEKVQIVAALANRMAKAKGQPVKIEATLDPEQALRDADFVVSQFRAGGLKARQRDEHIPLRYNMLGQETTGVGGFANALRTVPQALQLADRIDHFAPRAWLVNFTNPSGIVTEALLKHGWKKTVGLCNVAIGVEKGIAKALGVSEDRITLGAMGLNHLTWMKVYLDSQDITPKILGLEEGAQIEGRPANLPQSEWPHELLESIAMLPNGYLHYYYEYEHAVESEKAAVDRGEGTRADKVMAIEHDLFQMYADPNLTEKPALLSKRGGAYYSEAAVRLMVGLYTGTSAPQVLNVQNHGTYPELPDDAVVETACSIDKDGAHPLPSLPMPLTIRGIVQGVKAYEMLTVEAARTGNHQKAYEALLVHPLVRSAKSAEAVLADVIQENAQYLPQFGAIHA